MNQFCTIVSYNYLARVLVLDESRRTWCPEFTLHILVLDPDSSGCFDQLAEWDPTNNIELWYPGQVISPALDDVRSTRSWDEWVWTIKPHWILYLMQNLVNWTELTYIDGDMTFFNHPVSMLDELEGFDLGITPHRFSKDYARYLINGEFNGAFVHVKNTQNALNCISHWAGQCLWRCSLKHAEGSFVDQKYLDTWPERWGARRLQHKGVNLAPYNQGGGHYAYRWVDGQIMVDGQPLILYHYHGGPATTYPLDPFIRQHVYPPYVVALGRARRIIETCAS